MQMPDSGQIFHRKYQLKERLGTGPLSAVFRATDTEADRDVAIKILSPGEDGYSEGTESRFTREVKIVAKLRDPHNITMYDFGRSETDLLYMVFEYVPGVDLRQAIGVRAPMKQDETVHIFKQALQALREAHTSELLHRDIKPSNIRLYEYMGDFNRVKLLDFGIAKPVEATGDMQITRAGALIGTPQYMSPEQIVASGLTPASDIYSLGLVVYEMLVGKPAIEGETRSDFIRRQMAEEPIVLPPEAHAGNMLRSIVEKMCARSPDERYQSVDEILEDLAGLDPAVTADDGGDHGDTVVSPSVFEPGSPDTLDDASDTYIEPSEAESAAKTRLEPVGDLLAAGPQDETEKDFDAEGIEVPRAKGTDGAVKPPPAGVLPARERLPTPAAFKIVDAAERKKGSGEKLSMSTLAIIPIGLAIGAGVVLLLSALFGGDDDELPAYPTRAPVEIAHYEDGEPLAQHEEHAAEVDEQPTEKPADNGSVAAAVMKLPDAGAAEQQTDAAADAPNPNAAFALKEKGCGVDPPFQGERELAMEWVGKRRTWTTYLPKNYQKDKHHPVMFVFHSAGQTGRIIVRDTALKELADREGIVLLAPNSNKGDMHQMVFPFTGPNEGVFMQYALIETSKLVCLDRSRIYAIGHSLGGRMAERLACFIPLSGIATTGFRPLPDESVCEPQVTPPYIHLYGDQDRYLSVNDGPNCLGHEKVNQETHLNTWKYINKCSGEPSNYAVPGDGKCQQWTCETPFVSCVTSGGRDWPTAAPIEIEQKFDLLNCSAPPAEFPYRDVIWKFFQKHGRVRGE